MAKSKVLKDPIKPRFRVADRNFVAPAKEGATTGRFMPAGDDYDTGFKTPVGSLKCSSYESGPIPMKSVCFRCEDAM